MNARGEVHAYLLPDDYRRLRLEASARGVSLSRCAGDCLAEYFALRREMATAFEGPHQAETLAPPRVIHVLLAQTEHRLVATLERYGEDLAAVRAELTAVLTMLDRSQFTYLCYTPKVPPAARDQAQASGQRRFVHWRQAVARMLSASGRPVPWPLADPEGSRGVQRVELRGPHQRVPKVMCRHHRDRLGLDGRRNAEAPAPSPPPYRCRTCWLVP